MEALGFCGVLHIMCSTAARGRRFTTERSFSHSHTHAKVKASPSLSSSDVDRILRTRGCRRARGEANKRVCERSLCLCDWSM
ncbi:hypothetical protein BD309DRAFT_454078 [Dichomitus squalens]|nr:hypothetical protein BD309DRAFT_454078 [Dichomitus squalens]